MVKVGSTLFLDPFHATGPFLIYPVKTSENLLFSDGFRGYGKKAAARNWLEGLSTISNTYMNTYWHSVFKKCYLGNNFCIPGLLLTKLRRAL